MRVLEGIHSALGKTEIPNQRDRNQKEGNQGRKTHSIIVQQPVHSPVYVPRVPDEMYNLIHDRNDDNLGF